MATENSPSVFRDLDGTLVPTEEIGPFFASMLSPDLHVFPPKRYQWGRIRGEVMEERTLHLRSKARRHTRRGNRPRPSPSQRSWGGPNNLSFPRRRIGVSP